MVLKSAERYNAKNETVFAVVSLPRGCMWQGGCLGSVRYEQYDQQEEE